MMPYRRAMHYGAVSDRAFIADGQGRVRIDMQRAVILYIRAPTDDDRGHVATHYGIVPDARAFCYSDIANNHCAGRDKYIVRDGGPDTIKGEYWHCFLLLAMSELSGVWHCS